MSGQLTAVDRAPKHSRIAPHHGLNRCIVAAAAALGVLALFLAYYRLSWTAAANSDGAAFVFQAWDMLHGNVLLHGWWLGDASFYTTELPQYVLIEALRGPGPAVIHLAGAITYTLVVLMAAILAKGQATGREGLVRVLIAAGIMLTPQLGGQTFLSGSVVLLDQSPDHIGTSVPLLITWLVIDRADRRRVWVPAAVGVLLAWALVADPLVLGLGILPLVTVCLMRTYRAVVVFREPASSARFEISLTLAALAAVPAAAGALAVIHAHYGFTVSSLPVTVMAASNLLAQLSATFADVLTLFGANVLGSRVDAAAVPAFLHLAGVAMAGSAVWLGLRRFGRATRPDALVIEVVTAAIVVNLIAFVFTPSPDSVGNLAREITVVLPFSAVLAGRLLAGRLVSARLLPVLALVLLGYVFALGQVAMQPPQRSDDQQIAAWLAAQHLRYGLGGYWEANSVSLASAQQVQVRPVVPDLRGQVGTYPWMSQASWYDPRRHDANFVLLNPANTYEDAPYGAFVATFGNPDRAYQVGPYRVLVWHKNLLAHMGCGKPQTHPVQIGTWQGPQCS